MNSSIKITRSLRILGLSPDATPSEIKAAFRRLARSYHPDVAGKRYAYRFEEIADAYSLIKELSVEERRRAAVGFKATQAASPPAEKTAPWTALFRWSRKRREHVRTEAERRRRAMLEKEEGLKRQRSERVDRILERGKKNVAFLMKQQEESAQKNDMREFAMRLSSPSPEVRHLALSRLGKLVNQREILDSITSMLRLRDIDDKTARIVCTLPLDPENLKKLANALLPRGYALPPHLVSHLLRLHRPQEVDRSLADRYLQNANPEAAALILRQWPAGSQPSASAIRRLLHQEDEVFLVLLLGTMKQREIPLPAGCAERLKCLASHANVAIRVWAKALLSRPL